MNYNFKSFTKYKLEIIAFVVAMLYLLPRVYLYLKDVYLPKGFLEFTKSYELVVRGLMVYFYGYCILYFNTKSKRLAKKIPMGEMLFIFLVNVLLYLIFTSLYSLIQSTFLGGFNSELELVYNKGAYLLILAIMIVLATFLKVQESRDIAKLQGDRLKMSLIESELSGLKTQLNPHFLFNSLNSLSAMVMDNDQAVEFISELSDIYRYILNSSDRKKVSIEEELSFSKKYIGLQKIRHGDNLNVQWDFQAQNEMHSIPPMSIQLLLENAVKHNEISSSKPLNIQVKVSDESVEVVNEIQEKKGVKSTGVGLMNLNKRFNLLNYPEIKITKDQNLFHVTLRLK